MGQPPGQERPLNGLQILIIKTSDRVGVVIGAKHHFQQSIGLVESIDVIQGTDGKSKSIHRYGVIGTEDPFGKLVDTKPGDECAFVILLLKQVPAMNGKVLDLNDFVAGPGGFLGIQHVHHPWMEIRPARRREMNELPHQSIRTNSGMGHGESASF